MNTNKKFENPFMMTLFHQQPEKSVFNNDTILKTEYLSKNKISILLNELKLVQTELELLNGDLKSSFETLESKRAEFIGLFDLAPVSCFILNHLSIIKDVNIAGVNMLDTTKELLLNKNFKEYVAPEGWQTFFNFLFKLQSTKSKSSCELKLILSNQDYMYVRLEGIAIDTMQFHHPNYYITIIDITESKISAQRLTETKEKLEMTLEASSTGTWGLQMETKEVSMDDFSFALFGLNPWEYDGSHETLLKIIHPDDRESVRESIKRAYDFEKEIDIEFRIKPKSKAYSIKYIAARGHIIRGTENTRQIAGILMDITEKKILAHETDDLRLSQQKMVIAATFKAQEKERERISGALHDSVCQILYGIKLNLQTIERSGSYQNQQFKNINQLLDQVIKETRDISFELTPSILHDFGFTVGIREIARRLSTPDFLIRTKINEEANLLHPDIQLSVFRMIQELINNAIKHAEASIADIFVCTDDKEITIKVADNGKGLGEDYDQLLFNGSGLRGIKNRVYLLNGKMEIISKENKGSQIIIKFNKNAAITSSEK